MGGEADFNFRTPPSSPRGAKRRETPTHSGGTSSPSRSGLAKSHEEDVDPIHEIRNFAYSRILPVPPKKRSSSVVAPPLRDKWNAFPSYDRGFKVKAVADKGWTKVPREPRKDPDAESQEESEEESTDKEKTKSDESGPEEPPDESDESEAAHSEAVIDDVEEDMDLELEMETKEAKTKNKVTWLKYGHTESSSSDGDSETEEANEKPEKKKVGKSKTKPEEVAPPTDPTEEEDAATDEDDDPLLSLKETVANNKARK